MGNTSSYQSSQTEKYHVFQQGKNITLLQDRKTGQELCVRQLMMQSEKEFNEYKQFFETKINKNHRHLTQLREVRENMGFYKCSNLYRLKILFEHPFKTLRNQIDERKIGNNPFKENEILSILYSCLSGLRQLNDGGLSHNGIRADRIFISQGGFIKLSQPKLIDEISNLDLLRMDAGDNNLVISPEEILSWTEGRVYNLNKADIYCIGMIILEALTFASSREYYSEDYLEVDESKIQAVFDALGKTCSMRLRRILKNMLETHPQKRGSVEQIMQLMHQKQEQVELNIQNIENIENNFHKTTKLHRSMKSSMVLNVTNPPNVSNKRSEKQNINKDKPFPDPSTATVWVNKSSQNFAPEQIISNNHNQFAKTKIIRIIPNKIEESKKPKPLQPSHTNQSNNSSYSPCLQSLAVMKQDLEKISITSRQCLQFVREKSFPFYQQKQDQQVPPVLKYQNQSYNTISEVTEPQYSNLEEIRTVVEKYQEGNSYKGQKCGNLKHGFGTFYYKDGGYYQGEWKYDKMDGKGRLFYQPQRIAYDGGWKNDEFHGYGKVFNDKPNFRLKNQFQKLDFSELEDFWLYYEGQFVKDVKCGRGTVMLTNGDIFQGMFVDDAVHGPGKIVKANGEIIEGEWYENRLIRE